MSFAALSRPRVRDPRRVPALDDLQEQLIRDEMRATALRRAAGEDLRRPSPTGAGDFVPGGFPREVGRPRVLVSEEPTLELPGVPPLRPRRVSAPEESPTADATLERPPLARPRSAEEARIAEAPLSPPGMMQRPRVVDPETTIRSNMEHRAENTNSRFKGAVATGGRAALETLKSGGSPLAALFALVGGSAYGAVNKSADEQMAQDARTRGLISEQGRRRASQADALKLEAAQAGVGLTNAQADLARARPDIEANKLAAKSRVDEWRMANGDRKAGTAEEYTKWRMQNGDRRALTAEGQMELRREWQEGQADRFDRTFDQRERQFDALKEHRERQREIQRESLAVRREALARGADKDEAAATAAEFEADALEGMAASLEAEGSGEVVGGEAGALFGDPKYSDYQRGEARKRAEVLRKRAEGLRTRAVKPRARAAAQDGAPPLARPTTGGRFSESEVRSRALGAGRDPEAAVALARKKGLLR